ncbi:MAG TPA: VOC family protein [Tepidisphaeraceae bacterium]|jgi:predicted enzyme related to lactoylglutathione lyase
MLTKFSHVMLWVEDLDRAVKFWEQHFDFKPRMVAAGHYAVLHHQAMNFPLHLHPTKKGDPNVGHGPQVYFVADDLDREVARLRAAGLKVTDPRSESGSPRFCETQDSEGNPIGLTESRPAR